MDYRLYTLTPADQIVDAEVIQCDDEASAIRIVRDRASSSFYSTELWCRSRRVVHFPSNVSKAVGAPSNRLQPGPGLV